MNIFKDQYTWRNPEHKKFLFILRVIPFKYIASAAKTRGLEKIWLLQGNGLSLTFLKNALDSNQNCAIFALNSEQNNGKIVSIPEQSATGNP